MTGGMVGRGRERQAVAALLDSARTRASVLILDGEAGIGKTTLCRAAAEAGARAGFAVARASGAAAEVSLSWAVLADLLAGLDPAAPAGLSPLHRRALKSVSTGSAGPGLDERLVATAFRTALEAQCRLRPVLVVVDDAQWVDEASKLVLGFALRRLTGPAGLLVAYRRGEPGAADQSWARPPDPAALTRLTVPPMGPQTLSAVVSSRLGRYPEPPTMERIHRLSGGNPLYALELARSALENPGGLDSLPPGLIDLMGERIGEVDPATAEVLLTVASAFEPTVDLIAAATDRSPVELISALGPAERRGLLALDGPRIRFTHPLIGSAITDGAEPAARRQAHRRLAEAAGHPERRARHLALSAPHGDPETLAALDDAAEDAAARGVYSTAADLVGLAIRNGGDTWLRRLRGADFHLRAGALDEAESLAAAVVEDLPAGFPRTAGLMLIAGIRGYRDGVASTVGLLERAVAEAGDNLALQTQARVMLALSVGIGGDMPRCVEQAARARADADALGVPALRCQALTLWSHVSFMYGLGTDTEALRTALALEDPAFASPIMLRPTPVDALNRAWTGRLDEARATLTEVSRRAAERGNELDVLWAAEQLTMIDAGLGRYEDAQRTAEDALVRAEQVGGRLPLITAHTALANAAARRGQLEDARRYATLAIDGATAAGLHYLVRPPTMSLGFAEVSDGRYTEALETLKPLLGAFDPEHDTEIVAGEFLPDAVEALTATGRVEEAEPLTAALETAGARRERAWMQAVGARCRALVSAARGDLEAAVAAAEQAMAHHERLPMPFERARTQLLLGQLQRRRRRTPAAQAALRDAAATFESLGSPLWAARANRELERLSARSAGAGLTESERQVAERAARGLTNREIAAELYIAAKTVEMYLSNAYRKLGIRSRSQLAGRLRDL